MAGSGSEARFAGLSLVQLNELLEDEGQLTEMVQKMEEVSRAGLAAAAGPRGGRAGPGAGGRLEVPQVGLRGLGREMGGLETGSGMRGPRLGLSGGKASLEDAWGGDCVLRRGLGAEDPRLRMKRRLQSLSWAFGDGGSCG